jgi:hypothetical protein
MHYVHVRQRIAAFAGRLWPAADPAGSRNARLERSTATSRASAGLRAMNTLGAGRR